MELANNLNARNVKLISKSEYRKFLRKELPEECFKAHKGHLIAYFTALPLLILGLYLIATIDSLFIKIPISLLMGLCLATLTFFLHDLMHGQVFKSSLVEYIFGLSVGIFDLFCPTFWKRVHNFHHARTGNLDDPDRSYIEEDRPKNLAQHVAYKTRMSNEAYNPILTFILMSTGFIVYFSSTMINAFFPHKEENKYSRLKDLFPPKYRLKVTLELAFILLFQATLFFLVFNGSFLNFFLGSLFPIAFTHFTTMLYIHTNHFLSPLTGDVDDPLINSLSIKDCKFIDAIYLNFSHHVEHHLFPAMNSAYYPKVRELLLKHYPERYQMLEMKDAVKRLFNTPRIYDSFSSLSSLTKKEADCLLPTA